MIGTILKFDAEEGGLLRAADGRRYRFAAAEWRGKDGPEAGSRVDFDEDGDAAVDVHPLPAKAADGAAAAFSMAERPGLPIAILILIASVLPFLTLGPFSANLYNVVSVASSLGRYAPVNVNMETGLWLFHGLYAVPALALVLLLLEYKGLAGRWWRIGVGLAGLFGPVAIAFGARALFTAQSPQGTLTGRLIRKAREYVAPELFAPNIGLGWIALALLSLALVLIGIFWPARAERGEA